MMKRIGIMMLTAGIIGFTGCESQSNVTSAGGSPFGNPYLKSQVQTQKEMQEFVLNYTKDRLRTIPAGGMTVQRLAEEGTEEWLSRRSADPSLQFRELLALVKRSGISFHPAARKLQSGGAILDSLFGSMNWTVAQQERFYDVIYVVADHIQHGGTVESLGEVISEFDAETYALLEDDSEEILQTSAGIYAVIYAFAQNADEWMVLISGEDSGAMQKAVMLELEEIICGVAFAQMGAIYGTALSFVNPILGAGVGFTISMVGTLVCN